MSTQSDPVAAFQDRYQSGTGQFINWITDKLPVRLSEAQQRLLRSVANNRRTLVIGANGPGKSYASACLALAFLHTRRPSTVLATSGTYGKLKRTLCRPVQSLQEHDSLAHPLPGTYKHSPPRIDTDDPKWYLEASRPKDAGELEGTHNDHLLAITEEADKESVDEAVIESLDSCLTDKNDRHLVIANPPEDEGNVVYDLMESPKWNVVHFATWDSRNVRVDLGEHPGPKIPGLLGLTEVIEKWEEWNGEDWPGFEQARAWSDPNSEDFREDLDMRWYRRRAGIMPPRDSDQWRPFTVSDVEAAYNRATNGGDCDTFAVDVARSGDNTVGSGKHNDEMRIHYARQGTNHVTQKEELTDVLFDLASPRIAVDAVGEGSGLADELSETFADVTRFSNGMKARQESEYYDAWAEALALFGDFLDAGGSFSDKQLFEELKVTARTVEFSTRALTSRGGDVIEATSKSDVKERLGRSPDYMDSALMANWLDMVQQNTVNRRKARVNMQRRDA